MLVHDPLRLQFIQPEIDTTERHQLVVGALFLDPAVVHDHQRDGFQTADAAITKS